MIRSRSDKEEINLTASNIENNLIINEEAYIQLILKKEFKSGYF
ncbi:hypothetical protein DDB_G0267926 [Dictyostelium discoideum AX4]|nr:hypothetical protein DDB_G0267926 [Dictyostelium discoideum AX4]EAL73416.1 hypothetical protein DDB_G0267926 [Dictyostelium discoideum AX4]|eukprot:XP_647422.1 hypothetical protein DDB_G0267926 [Dictyostelium discoideum AX4]